MDQETREFLERKFDAINGKFDAIDGKFDAIDGKFQETKRYFGIVAEGLERKIQQVAEGVVNLDEKLERFRQGVVDEFKEVKSMIKLSYAELDRRMITVEGEVAVLKARLDRLEARR